jgi:hypothetical protein
MFLLITSRRDADMKGALIVRSFADDINYSGCGTGKKYDVAFGDCSSQRFSLFDDDLRSFWSASFGRRTTHNADFGFHNST